MAILKIAKLGHPVLLKNNNEISELKDTDLQKLIYARYEQMIDAIKKHGEVQIEKHKTNVEVLMQKPSGVADQPDHLETIEKELKVIAEYDDQLEMIKKYFVQKDPFKS